MLVRLTVVCCACIAMASCNWRPTELLCTGTVSWGKETFSDKLMLRVWQWPHPREVEVSGEGRLSTFEAGLEYKVCFESVNELDFEYTTELKCGSAASTRYGHLHKVTGNLHLSRSDRGPEFAGDYTCKPAQRVLD